MGEQSSTAELRQLENLNEKKVMDYFTALLFRPNTNDETQLHLRSQLVSVFKVATSLYDLHECWDCNPINPCDSRDCLKTLSPSFTRMIKSIHLYDTSPRPQ